MARVTVEDCLARISSQYDLVLLAKERTTQLNTGEKSLVPEEGDKNTVIALREIEDETIPLDEMKESLINDYQTIPMLEVEDNSKDPGTVVQEIQKGYMMKDRLLRPSLVSVTKKRDEKEEKTKKDEKK